MIKLIILDYQNANGSLRVSTNVRNIGQALHDQGGLALMRHVAYRAVDHGVRSLWMNEAWNEIGYWRS